MWVIHSAWVRHQSQRYPADGHHDCCTNFNENADLSWERLVDIQCARVGSLRLLEYGSCASHRLGNVNGIDLSSDFGRRAVVR